MRCRIETPSTPSTPRRSALPVGVGAVLSPFCFRPRRQDAKRLIAPQAQLKRCDNACGARRVAFFLASWREISQLGAAPALTDRHEQLGALGVSIFGRGGCHDAVT